MQYSNQQNIATKNNIVLKSSFVNLQRNPSYSMRDVLSFYFWSLITAKASIQILPPLKFGQ